MATFGFLGAGNMGGALARAACKTLTPDKVILSSRSMEKARALAAELGCRTAESSAVAEHADYLFLGVKPQMMAGLLKDLHPILKQRADRFLLVTMAAGLSIADIQRMAGGTYPVIRIMPNTPASISEGMILYTCGTEVTKEEEAEFLHSMAGAGTFSALPENLIDAGCSVSGCGPAFVDLFIEALADGGVACGLPRAKALEFAAQTIVGSAKLLQETGAHPGVLKDAVCSPGGSTIQGVRVLEKAGFRSAVMEAVIAAFEKNQALGK